MNWTWEKCAKYCEETYGIFVDWNERYFICGECAEPIYEEDWEEHIGWTTCPICNFNYITCEYEEEDE